MITVCAWCKKVTKQDAEHREGDLVSHGICAECAVIHFNFKK